TNLQTDEAMLTGESIEVKKSEHSEDNNLYMGCIITKGNAIAKVTNTGMKTKMGSIANMLDDIKEEETPLQKRLASLSKYIAAGCLIICAVVTITGIIRGENVFDMLITGVSLAVAAVPEGLPAIVTISLALSVSRMVKRKALVKKLHAVETLGCADVICSDKTGTLTQNKMTATNIYIYDEEIDKERLLNQKVLLNAIKACNNASISESGAIGDQTEICLLRLIDGYSFKHDRISEIPFDSTRKRMSVTVKQDDGVFTYTKGAMDVLLKRCTGILTGNGVIEMTNERKRIIEQKNNEMADKALRVIAITYSNGENASEEGLVFLGLIGMIDPPRKEVKSAVSLCKKAGIKTVMITGDHKKTAMAIAKELLIYRAGDMALTGEELDLMADEELSSLIENVTVFARVTPAHKLRIVRALKKRNHIVAMTGDGVNDAPAIKEADIGVSM
ncbi:MAG: HAD-IC family P-type ATPase, partial [Oscillospiraceae bacterium]